MSDISILDHWLKRMGKGDWVDETGLAAYLGDLAMLHAGNMRQEKRDGAASDKGAALPAAKKEREMTPAPASITVAIATAIKTQIQKALEYDAPECVFTRATTSAMSRNIGCPTNVTIARAMAFGPKS